MLAAEHYDVVIAGGGMGGASLALLLSRRSEGKLRVLVVESLLGMKRAGADILITYYAAEVAKWINEKSV